ncbi:MAG TPA: FKBP-type peptidyl-prolyl cis-trans isomerase [Solirubrobacterales bacterium]|nr:FKBP-type peptidyl-prolyl cis-trans isomerase [Solirubrobacterales bacterium]
MAGSEPKPVIPQSPPPEFLAATDLIEGIGVLATDGSPVVVQYVAYDYEGNKLASSWDEGKPVTFTVGKGEVIEGWEEGIPSMEVGDRRELVVPADETKGPFPKGLPQGEPLIFVIETLPSSSLGKAVTVSGKPAQKANSSQTAAAADKTKPKVKVPSGPPPKKLEIKDLEEGSGPEAKPGDEVTVHYVGVNYKTGKQFDASWDRGEPFTFKLGEGLVVPGWEEGIPGMKPGGRRELIIPPELGYGYRRVEGIPPGSTLVFVVDLISVE